MVILEKKLAKNKLIIWTKVKETQMLGEGCFLFGILFCRRYLTKLNLIQTTAFELPKLFVIIYKNIKRGKLFVKNQSIVIIYVKFKENNLMKEIKKFESKINFHKKLIGKTNKGLQKKNSNKLKEKKKYKELKRENTCKISGLFNKKNKKSWGMENSRWFEKYKNSIHSF